MAKAKLPHFTGLDWFHLAVALLYIGGIFGKLPWMFVGLVWGEKTAEHFHAEIAVAALVLFTLYMTAAATYFLRRWRDERYQKRDAENDLAVVSQQLASASDREGRVADAVENLTLVHSDNCNLLGCIMQRVDAVPAAGLSEPDRAKLMSDFNHLLSEFGRSFLIATVDLFVEITGDESCAACTKMLKTKDGEEATVHIGHRDPESDRKRKYDDRHGAFSYKQNTAFRTICEADDDIYVCDDIKSSNEYRQADGEPRPYNATLVCALRAPGTRAAKHIAGFLCVDNKTGGLDNDKCKRYLGVAGLLYHDFFSFAEDLHEVMKRKGVTNGQEINAKFRARGATAPASV